MLTSSKYCIFGQFLDVIGPHSQVKRHVTYIYSERTFYGYRILFTKHKKLFLFLTNKPFSNALLFLIFADVSKYWRRYGSKLYTSRLHLTGSTSWPSFMIRALTKLGLWKIIKMLASSKLCSFGQFLNVVEPHSHVKRHVFYMYSERTFYWLSSPFYKAQGAVFVLEK